MLGISLIVPLLIGSAVFAAPVADQDAAGPMACTKPLVRRAWYNLTLDERRAYLDAELCLMKMPQTLNLRGAKTKFDELQSLHVYKADVAHFTGEFFPFHRAMIWAHEQYLRNLCNYTGAHPYWEETVDAGKFSTAAIMDPKYGFGGNGVGASQCIADGPFAWYNNSMGPFYAIGDHCITRAISDPISLFSSQSIVLACYNITSYVPFWNCVESAGPHTGGHGGISAEMVNLVSSPGDPIFYMHHGWLDSLWAKWQDMNLTARLTDVGGTNRGIAGNFPGAKRPADLPPSAVIGDPGTTVTLNHVIDMLGITRNFTVGELMDTRKTLCYEYQ